jgi:hypothetical protein
VQVDLAPAPREGELPVRRQRLVAEEDHQVVVQRLADLAEHLVVEVARQVDALDLGAERAGDAADLEMAVLAVPQPIHGASPPPCADAGGVAARPFAGGGAPLGAIMVPSAADGKAGAA